MKLECTSHGAPGRADAVSEDALRTALTKGGLIAALADGMGAARHGGPAAQRAVAMMVDYYLTRPQSWSARRALTEFAGQVNRLLFQESMLQYDSPELLSTLSVVAVEGNRAYGINVGDSPVYLYRRGRLTRLSEIHALEQEGMRHVLTRAAGLAEEIKPFVFESTLEAGDLLLLCSDGVSTALSETALGDLLSRRASARSIVTTALQAAGEEEELRDDASAVVIEVIEADWNEETQKRPVEVAGALRAAERVADYTLVRALGANDRVWLARRDDGVEKVLKFPPIDARRDEVLRDAFVKEVWQASRIDSPDFVRASVPSEGALRYYEMDYIEAPTLREGIGKAPLKVEEAVSLGVFLLRAAQYLLGRDLAHGDIKPENILVLRDRDGVTFKLLDLGSVADVFSVTSRAGTPSYVAPERFHDAALSERTEIFAIGATLYEVLARHLPYGEIERFQHARFDHPPRSLSWHNPAVPGWLNSIVLRAVAPEVDRRYQHFSEMIYDLQNPGKVAEFYRKDAPLLERNPVLFFKLLALALGLTNAFLLYRLFSR